MTKASTADGDRSHADQSHTTTDLDLAAFLLCRGIEPQELKPPLPHAFPNFATFVFARTALLEDTLTEWAGSHPVTVDLREFLNRRRQLYRRIRALRESGR